MREIDADDFDVVAHQRSFFVVKRLFAEFSLVDALRVITENIRNIISVCGIVLHIAAMLECFDLVGSSSRGFRR